MSGSIRRVDFRGQRHKKRGKDLIDSVCYCIESLDCEIAGYAVVAWKDNGKASVALRSGGLINIGGLSNFVYEKVRGCAESAV